MYGRWSFLFVLFFGLLVTSMPALANRDASFLSPSASNGNLLSRGEGAVGVEPKSEIDLGETAVNVAKRTTIFFVNLTTIPVGIVGIKAAGDSTVDAEIVADDCSKQGTIAASSRCAVSVEVTPKGSGLWTAEVLLTHDAAGRLARAKLIGKTSTSGGEKNSTGLSLSTKEARPVDFEEVETSGGKAVRTALMVNDSNEPITIYSIEVIAAENGLERLDQGCVVDMDLKPGESCPVTLVWTPEVPGIISTDLIIRHSGKMGFAVIPIRGLSKLSETENASLQKGNKKGGDVPSSAPPALADQVQNAASSRNIQAPHLNVDDLDLSDVLMEEEIDIDGIHLIGTVGNRGLFYMPDGQTQVVGVGEEIELGKTGTFKLLNVTPRQAEVVVNGANRRLELKSVNALTKRAAQASLSRAKKSKTKTTTKEPNKKILDADLLESE